MVYIIEKEIFRCATDGECDHMCVTPGIPKCVASMCFCFDNL